MNIVLYEPEIPYNTGNIGRTCVAANVKLHLIRPLGFSLEQKEIHRAGLDYWPKLKLEVYDCFDEFLEKNSLGKKPGSTVTEKAVNTPAADRDAQKAGIAATAEACPSSETCLEENVRAERGDSAAAGDAASPRLWLATTKAHQVYTDVHYNGDDFIMFGPESRGIPEEILVERERDCIRIPMYEDTRSLNLCNSAAIVLYEALRQNDFRGLRKNGELHRLKWRV